MLVRAYDCTHGDFKIEESCDSAWRPTLTSCAKIEGIPCQERKGNRQRQRRQCWSDRAIGFKFIDCSRRCRKSQSCRVQIRPWMIRHHQTAAGDHNFLLILRRKREEV